MKKETRNKELEKQEAEEEEFTIPGLRKVDGKLEIDDDLLFWP